MNYPKKQYILWIGGGEGYTPTECDSITEALLIEKYTGDWYVTEAINDVSGYGQFRKEDKK